MIIRHLNLEKHSIIEPIDVVEGNGQQIIMIYLNGFTLTRSMTVTAYVETPKGNFYQTVGELNTLDNLILFIPKSGLFRAGKCYLQFEISYYDSKSVKMYTPIIEVNCERNLAAVDPKEEAEVLPPLLDQAKEACAEGVREALERFDSSLLVYNRVVVVQHPSSATVEEDSPVEFICETLALTGHEVEYNWQYRKLGEVVWNDTGSHHKHLCLTAKANLNGREYRCKITDQTNHEVIYTESATLTVYRDSGALMITAQPTNVSVALGQSAGYSVSAKGKGTLSYQWYYKRVSDTDFILWSGRTTASIEHTPSSSQNGMQVRCVVTDSNGSVTSDVATVEVVSAVTSLTADTQPESVETPAGKTVAFYFGCKAPGAVTYQWYYKNPGTTSYVPWSGKTTPNITYTPSASKDGMQIYCVASDGSKSVTSDIVTITIL